MVRNRHLARAIGDAGWSEWRRMLAYKTVWYGSRLIVAPRFDPSTKTCSACGHVKDEMPLGERVFRCAVCGWALDRERGAKPRVARRREFPGDGKRLWRGRLWLGERLGETGPGKAGPFESETGRRGGRNQKTMRRGMERPSLTL